MPPFAQSVCGLLLLAAGVLALYEEEAGVNDWRKENIGKLKGLVHPAAKSGIQRSKAFVITESNTVACLDMTTGAVVWRQTLLENDELEQVQLSGRTLLTISSNGRFVRAWNAQDGVLLWDNIMCPRDGGSHVFDTMLPGIDVDGDDIADVALLCDNVLQMRAGTDGSLIWDAQHNSKGGLLNRLSISASESISSELPSLVIAGLVASAGEDDAGEGDVVAANDSLTAVTSTNYDLRTGAMESDATVTASGGAELRPGSGQTIAAGWQVALDKDTDSLVLFRMAEEGGTSFHFPLSDVADLSGAGFQLQQSPHESHVMVTSDAGQTSILKLSTEQEATPKLTLVHTFELQGSTLTVAGEGEQSRIAAVSVLESGTKVELFQLPTATKQSLSLSEPMIANNGVASDLYSILTKKRDGEFAHRLLLVTADDAIHMIEATSTDTEPKWSREEGLAKVATTTFVENAPALDAVGDLPLAGLYRQFADMAAKAMAEPGSLPPARRPKSGEATIRGDTFGFRKVALLVSSVGKLFALDTFDGGSELWSFYFGGHPSLAAGNGSVQYAIFDLRLASEDSGAQCLLLAKLENSMLLFSFDPISGALAGPIQEISQRVVHTILSPLTVKLADSSRIAVIIDDAHGVHLFPDTVEAQTVYDTFAPSCFYFLIDKDTALVNGFQAKSAGSKAPTSALWSLSFKGEKWETFAMKHPDEFVQSPVRIMPDRSVMYKYLNPNVALIATSTPNTVETEPVVTIYIVDTVTGHILSRTRHKNARGPVTAVVCEHWAIYHYWSLAQAGRFELGVIELYDGSESILGAEKVFDVLRGNSEREGFSSFNARSPQVARQTQIFPHAVRTLAVSRTRHGVTLRHVLMGLASGQVFSLDKRFSDPRAPVNRAPTQEEQEEGIIPYQAVVPVHPMRFPTYNQTVPHLRMIEPAPSRIESAGHILAVGLDLFYTRIAPSNQFDALPDDFSYLILIMVIAGMAGLTGFAWHSAKRKALAEAWR